MKQFQIGARPTFTATFKTAGGTLTTPTQGNFKLEKPDGTDLSFPLTDPSVTIVSPGIVNFVPPAAFDTSGFWYFRSEGTEAIIDAYEEKFEVLPSAFSGARVARYCTGEDLLIGDMTVSPATTDRFVIQAADEMDAEIGQLYLLPISIPALQAHVQLKLKQCNTLIATGRYLLAQAVGSEAGETHAYGESLLREGRAILKEISTGQFDLVGATRRPSESSNRAPQLVNTDSVSAVDAFYSRTGLGYRPDGAPDFWGPNR